MPDHFERSLRLHEQLRGKIEVRSKAAIESQNDLSAAYTPGVARTCEVIAEDPQRARQLTVRGNSVAIVTDGTAVLGLGDIGPVAALPVMEGKALLFKEFAEIDAWPICLDTKDTEEIVRVVRAIAPTFGGVNLEDISAPRCFAVEDQLQDLGIPVMHDDQHGTAIVLFAALLNAAKVVGKPVGELRVVVNGAGAAGTAIAKLLRCSDHVDGTCVAVGELIVCDSKGAIHRDRENLSREKRSLLDFTNPNNERGLIDEVLRGKDVFVGVSKANLLTREHIATMKSDAIVFGLANPIPEIFPDEAKAGGAAVVGTGRSDFPNQINNVLAFPGLFRGALDAEAPAITNTMKLAAAKSLAEAVAAPSADRVLPSPLQRDVASTVAAAVKRVAMRASVE